MDLGVAVAAATKVRLQPLSAGLLGILAQAAVAQDLLDFLFERAGEGCALDLEDRDRARGHREHQVDLGRGRIVDVAHVDLGAPAAGVDEPALHGLRGFLGPRPHEGRAGRRLGRSREERSLRDLEALEGEPGDPSAWARCDVKDEVGALERVCSRVGPPS